MLRARGGPNNISASSRRWCVCATVAASADLHVCPYCTCTVGLQYSVLVPVVLGIYCPVSLLFDRGVRCLFHCCLAGSQSVLTVYVWR